jgi:ankyrin repeat protein
MAAARNDHPGVLKLLIERGADLDAMNDADYTALLLAAARGNVGCVKVLLEAGAGVDYEGAEGCTPLMQAAMCGARFHGEQDYVNVMLVLTAAGADPNARNRFGETALKCAAEAERAGELALRYLLVAGAEIDPLDGLGRTPLMGAANHGQVAKASLLLSWGANVAAVDKEGNTALILAGRWSDPTNVATMRVLLNGGADANKANADGATALREAARHGNIAGAQLLLERGAEVNRRDKTGSTPLSLALKAGYNEVAALLLRKGALE